MKRMKKMKRKIFYGSLVGLALFLIAYLIATRYNYASEVYVIGMIVCAVICLVTGICKENIVLNLVVFLSALSIFLVGFLTGALLWCFISVLLVVIFMFYSKIKRNKRSL